jgi:phosphoglycolate phosphatase
MIRHVIWDWNGTLLDDVDHALHALNRVLEERGKPQLDRSDYRRRFGFPVRAFYGEIGFDLETEDFAALSERFMGHYNAVAAGAPARPDAIFTVRRLSEQGVLQSVVSAMEVTLLSSMLRARGLLDHLAHVRGLDHLQASSKVALGVDLMESLRAQGAVPDETLFVGDTLHDLETADAMGCRCVLYAHGHQAPERWPEALGSRWKDIRIVHTIGEILHVVGE